MSRIIKASSARYTERREFPRAADLPPDDAKDMPLEAIPSGDAPDATQSPVQASPAITQADMQAAYDELISAAQDEVASILGAARDDAQILLRDAEKQAEDIRQNGYEEGYRLGLRQAEEDTVDILRKAEQDAAEFMERTRAEHDRILSETEPKLLKLALEVAEKILHHELEANDSAYMSILSNAVGAVKAESNVSLRVNPADYVRYFNSRENAKIRTANGNVSARVTIDSSVDAGGCLIETDSGSINSSPSAQISQIANSLGLASLE